MYKNTTLLFQSEENIQYLATTENDLKVEKDVDAVNFLFTQDAPIAIQHKTELERKKCE